MFVLVASINLKVYALAHIFVLHWAVHFYEVSYANLRISVC